LNISELIGAIQNEADGTLKSLRDISNEENSMIEQLDIMEKNLDRYLEIADKNNLNINNNQNDNLYSVITEISKNVDVVQREINDVENKMFQNKVEKSDNLKSLNYEFDKQKDNNFALDVRILN
jgi:hypothetical protein